MSLFVLDEFEMAPSQSEKLARKRKAEAKCDKRIIEDLKLHDTRNESVEKYAAAKQKSKVRNYQRKFQSLTTQMENSEAEWESQETSRVSDKFEFCFWVLRLSRWALITFFNGSLSFFFCLAPTYCFRSFLLRVLIRSRSSIIHL